MFETTFEISRQLPTLVQACERIRAGQLPPIQLWEQCTARIARFDNTLHAWSGYASHCGYVGNERTEQAAAGDYIGLLHGIPIGVKDIIDVAGMPTKGGSPLLASAPPATADAPIVAALRKQGAVILGKTETCQFACFDPAPTLNPWDYSRTPGGSSAGSAVAVAVGQCLAALGTQTGGSILRPAAYCGVSGFKPGFDPRWQEGVLPVSYKLDHVGPLARKVNDLALVWRAVIGAESATLGKRLHQPPRIGVLREYFWEHSSDEVRRLTQAALDRWAALGAQIVDVPLPAGFSEVHRAHRIIMAHDCAAVHRENYAQQPTAYLPNISALIEEGLQIAPELHEQATIFQGMFRQHLPLDYPDIDVLAMPTVGATAPARETTGDSRFQVPWSFAGVPAVTFPSGLASDGLPCGIQLVNPHGQTPAHDFELLAIASWCEECLGLDMLALLTPRLEAMFPDLTWIDAL